MMPWLEEAAILTLEAQPSSAPLIFGTSGDTASSPDVWIAGVVMALVGFMSFLTIAFALADPLRAKRLRYRTRRLSPGKIVGYEGSDEPTSPEELSRSIIERAAEIRRTLEGSPSEIRVEMCTLGYRACVNDAIALTRMVDEEIAKAGTVRRLRLRVARHRATKSVCRVRKALSPYAPCVWHH